MHCVFVHEKRRFFVMLYDRAFPVRGFVSAGRTFASFIKGHIVISKNCKPNLGHGKLCRAVYFFGIRTLYVSMDDSSTDASFRVRVSRAVMNSDFRDGTGYLDGSRLTRKITGEPQSRLQSCQHQLSSPAPTWACSPAAAVVAAAPCRPCA